jgi:hypothetical protein
MPRPVLGNYDGAVVSGFLLLGLGLRNGLAPLHLSSCFETHCFMWAVPVSPTTTVLRTLASTPVVVARKESVHGMT